MSSNSISVGHEIIKSAKWRIISSGTSYVFMFASMIVLARFIKPSEYGTAALVISSIAFFNIISQFGFSPSIVGIKDIDKLFIDTLFTFSLIFASVLYIILFIVSPKIAKFYNNPILSKLLIVTGFTLFLNIIMSIPIALLHRSLNYKRETQVFLIMSLISSITAIIMAILGAGVWALVIPPLVGNLFSVFLAFYFAEYYPAFKLDISRLRKSLNFGLSSFVSNITSFFFHNSIELFMGKIWPSTVLGYYTFAKGKYLKVIEAFSSVSISSLFPILSKVSEDKLRLKNIFFRISELFNSILIPIYVILIVGAHFIFNFLFGDIWNQAIIPFQLLCFTQIIRSITIAVNHLQYAINQPDVPAKVQIVVIPIYIFIIYICYIHKTNLITVIIIFTIFSILLPLLNLVVCFIKLKFSIKEFFRHTMLYSLLSSLVLFFVLNISFKYLRQNSRLNIISFMSVIFVSLLLYVLVRYKYFFNQFLNIRSILRTKNISLLSE